MSDDRDELNRAALEAQRADRDQAEAEAERKAEIAKRLKLKAEFITRVKKGRHYVKHEGEVIERPDSLCNNCGGSHVKRGHCTNCGARA